jgi:HSP20 family protein
MSIFKRKKAKDLQLALNQKPSLGLSKEKEWLASNYEGELAIDAFETEKELVVQSTIAGVSAKDLDISVEDGMLVIKGKREKPKTGEKRNYFQQECFWGSFSKRMILPEKVKITQAKATIKNGVLCLRIPKAGKTTSKKITIQDK